MKNMQKKNSRKEKWRNVSINPSNIDEYMIDLIEDTKGQYITQGVSFNKDDSFQMGLLKQSILNHSSFSGLVKHLLTVYFSGQQIQSPNTISSIPIAFHHTREVQESPPASREETKETTPSTPSSTPVVDKKVDTNTVPEKKEEKSSDESPPKRKRVSPRKNTGGGFLQANPNAKPPKDSSTN